MSTDNTNDAARKQVNEEVEEFRAKQNAEKETDEPEDAGTIQSLDEVTEDRDEEGNRVPKPVYSEQLGAKIEVLHPNEEEERLLQTILDDEDADNEDVAELFEAVFPVYDNVSAQSITDMTQKTMNGHIVAILKRNDAPQRQIDMVRGELTDELVDYAEKAAKIEQSSRPGNR